MEWRRVVPALIGTPTLASIWSPECGASRPARLIDNRRFDCPDERI